VSPVLVARVSFNGRSAIDGDHMMPMTLDMWVTEGVEVEMIA
jgi:hypothetical protein